MVPALAVSPQALRGNTRARAIAEHPTLRGGRSTSGPSSNTYVVSGSNLRLPDTLFRRLGHKKRHVPGLHPVDA